MYMKIKMQKSYPRSAGGGFDLESLTNEAHQFPLIQVLNLKAQGCHRIMDCRFDLIKVVLLWIDGSREGVNRLPYSYTLDIYITNEY